MKRLLLATIGLLIVAFGLQYLGCGETDPALAPAGSSIQIIGGTEGGATEDTTYSCDSDWNIPIPCFTSFRTFCLRMCVNDVAAGNFDNLDSGARQIFDDCPFDEAVCADQVCDDGNYWIMTCENRLYGAAARDYIRSKAGRCGYINYLISAVVQSSAEVISTEGTEAVTRPMNDVEVRWVANGGEMYMPADIPGEIEPLGNPFYDQTDDRGLSEIKYRIPIPTRCGDEISYSLAADIGVDASVAEFKMAVEDSTEEDDDDDDSKDSE